MPQLKQTNRVFYADVLRMIAITAVIMLHNASDYVGQYNQIPTSHWWAGAIYDGLVRFCVPMFVMLSGAFLLKPGKNVTMKELFFKRLPKILIPLIFWSIVYVIFENYTDGNDGGNFKLKEALITFYQGPVIYHFWFLYMMIGIYFIYPIINLFITAAKEIHIRYFLLVWFFVNSIFGIIEIFSGLSLGIELNSFSGYVGYFVLGYYLTHYTFTGNKLKLSYILALIGFSCSILTPYILHHLHVKHITEFIESDFTPDIVLSVIGLYLWMKNRSFNIDPSNWIYKFISMVSMESFGIYLIHVLIMEILFADSFAYSHFFNDPHPFLGIPLKTVSILLLSLLIVKTIRLVPVLKKVVG